MSEFNNLYMGKPASYWAELEAENQRLKEAITEFLDTDPYYECTEKALRKLEEAK